MSPSPRKKEEGDTSYNFGHFCDADVFSGAESLRRRTCRTNHRVYRHASFGKYASYRLGWRYELPDPPHPKHVTRKQRCARKSARSRATRPGGEIAKVPTENPEPRGNQGHIQAHVRTHTRTREISEGRGLRSPVFSSERTRANFALVPTAQMADGAIRAELPVGSRRSDGPVGFAGPYGRNLMQAPPRIRGRIRVLLRDLGVAD